jgi:hypothetical protein
MTATGSYIRAGFEAIIANNTNLQEKSQRYNPPKDSSKKFNVTQHHHKNDDQCWK